MKVLIVGEFSGFAKNLAKGINGIEGNEAVVFAYQDGFKKIQQDSFSYTYDKPYNIRFCGFELKGTSRLTGFMLYRKFKRDLKKYHRYFDAVFIISYTLLRDVNDYTKPLFSKEDILYVVKDPAKVFMSSCGGDMAYYHFCLQDKRLSTVYSDCSILNNPLYERKRLDAQSIVRGVIPMSYQYQEAYRLFGKEFMLLNTIPLPFDSLSVKAKKEYCKGGKVVIFNGGLRPTKGTKFIDEALERIKEQYPDKVIVRNDRFPYDQFLEFLREIDIYIDLCTDYDYGMSAIAAMLAGCAVLSGNEPETRLTFKQDYIPVVSASPDSTQIYKALEDLILNQSKIEEIGRRAVIYAHDVHDCIRLAPEYLKTFKF